MDIGKKLGLTHGIIASANNVEKEIMNILGENAVDIAIETTGNARVIEQAYKLTKPNGKTILVGVANKNDKISIYTLPLHFKNIIGSHGGDSIPDVDIPRYIRLMNANKMILEELITHEFKLSEINNALELFRS